ncbi:ATP-binding protein [Ideonella sp.]|jgi:signal transduction histidine kinase|uniref:ATP-binding protein n=1 Tax=Ideonella sp. TaxID=1929293 RepID=UPI0037C0FD7B
MIQRWLAGLRGSLQWRLLLVTLAGIALALALTGLTLYQLFSAHVQRQFQADLAVQLEQLTARLEFNASGQPVIDPSQLSDPRWLKPLSGRYWQVDVYAPTTKPAAAAGVLRSRSLWDEVLTLPADVVADGDTHLHEIAGPSGRPLLAIERTVRPPAPHSSAWTLVVAADASEAQDAARRFARVLAGTLAVLMGLLALAAAAQVWVGLAPLRALKQAVLALDSGQEARLRGRFPAEIQPLADGFNRALQRQEEGLTRARTQAGNLAHALKTPLAVLRHTAEGATQPAQAPAMQQVGQQIREQVDKAQQHIDWHLRRARSAASAASMQRPSCALLPTLQGLQRVMSKVHAQRSLHISIESANPNLHAPIEQQDLHDMLGNLIDNACKWARSQVRIQVDAAGAVTIDDDGPGIPAAQRALMCQRGQRLDEHTPGSGLGLAIVSELAELYGAELSLSESPLGGLRARLSWGVSVA